MCWIAHAALRATLNKAPRNKVDWTQTFLLVKSFKLVPKLLEKDSRPRQIKL
jgi:hypothetical protein